MGPPGPSPWYSSPTGTAYGLSSWSTSTGLPSSTPNGPLGCHPRRGPADRRQRRRGLAAGGGFVVFAFGYIIGTLTYAVLRLFFRIKAWCCGGSRYHEAGLLSHLGNVWPRTGHPGAIDPQQELSAVIVFDFGIIRGRYEGVHQWLVRRWNAFSIGTTGVAGLLLSFVIGHWMFSISFRWEWWVPVGILLVACFYVSCCAWHDWRRMVAFMAQMPDALLKPKRGLGGKASQP
jgi:hypothetical protein